jgi:hypothetical protein
MSLEEDLRARTLALISQQMANWVVEIQRQIGDRQASIMRSLDELQETVAAYDERINESDIHGAMAEVLASQPPPPPPVVAPGYDRLKASLAEVDKGTSLSEALTLLVNEVGQYVDRAAMFIVKGPSAIGWYGRGFQPPDAVKQINVSLNADTVFRNVHNSRHALRGSILHTPGTAQALARLGGQPQGVLAVPLLLRDKLAAILYCDSTKEEIPPADADLIEVLVLFAGKSIDLLSVAPKGAAASAPAAASSQPSRDSAPAAKPPAPAARPVPAPPPAASASHPSTAEASSTVMFSASQIAAMRPQPAARPAAPPPPPAAAMSPEDQKAHEDAKRFARLVVSEIKLYNEAKVNEGRRQKDIYERLKEDIERGRQMYTDRVAAPVRDATNYFYDELVRILAGGDASALGPM